MKTGLGTGERKSRVAAQGRDEMRRDGMGMDWIALLETGFKVNRTTYHYRMRTVALYPVVVVYREHRASERRGECVCVYVL